MTVIGMCSPLLGAGADGYCLKEVSGNQLISAIRAVADGVAWLDPGVASRVLRACATNNRWPGATEELSLKCLRLVCCILAVSARA